MIMTGTVSMFSLVMMSMRGCSMVMTVAMAGGPVVMTVAMTLFMTHARSSKIFNLL